jgi:hypothetical protein
VAAQRSAHAGQQFLNAKGLGNVIVRTGIQGHHLVAFRIAHGQHDYGSGGKVPQFPASFDAGDSRQIHVQ